MLNKIFMFGARNRVLSIIIAALITLVASFGLQHIELDASSEALFDPNDPAKAHYEKMVKTFGSDLITQVYLKDENLLSVEKLTLLEDLHYQLADLELVEKVESLFTAASVRNVEGDLDTTPLLDTVPETQEEIDRLKKYARTNPFVVKNLIGQDDTVTVISVKFTPDLGDDKRADNAYNQVKEILEPFKGKFDKAFQIGSPRIIASTKHGITSDMLVLTPIAGAVILLGMILFLRNFQFAVLPIVTSIFSIVWTFGFMGLLGVPINLLSAGLPLLLIAVGSTEDTHMVGAYLRGLENVKATKKSDIRELSVKFMMSKVGIATLVTAGTTALGFGSGILSSVKILQDFGMATSLGMISNLVATVLLVPLMLKTFGPTVVKTKSNEDQIPTGIFEKIYKVSIYFTEKQWKPVLVITFLIAVVGFGFGSQLKANNDPMSYLKNDNPVAADADLMHEDVAGIQMFNVVIEGQGPGYFVQPKNLQKIKQIQDYLKSTGYFDNVISIADHVAYVNREMTDGKDANYIIPDNQMLIEQYLLFFQRSDMENFVTTKFDETAILVRHNIFNSITIEEVLSVVVPEINRIAGPEMTSRIVSENILINRASQTLVDEQVKSFGIVILVILVLISLMYSSFPLGLVSLVPNILPACTVFGVMSLFDMALNPGTVLVTVVALGIAVDDTIHLLTAYSQASQSERNSLLAARSALSSQIVAVCTTSISLVISFLIFRFSEFSVVSDFGILCATGLITAVLADLIITPIFLRFVRLVSIFDIIGLELGMESIRKSPLFANMSDFKIRKTVLLCDRESFTDKAEIITQGSEDDHMYVVLKGRVNVNIESDHGMKKIAQLHEGQVFGEIGFTGAALRTAQVEADGEVELLRLNAEDVGKSLKLYPNIAAKLYHNIAIILGQRLHGHNAATTGVPVEEAESSDEIKAIA